LGLPEWPEHFIINCLSSLAIQLEGHKLSKAQLKAFKQSFKLLEIWSHESPFNYESKYLLALAEYQLLNNNKPEAKQNFNKALVSSQNAGMKYMTAIIYERIAAMYERDKEAELAERNLNFAVLEYQDWGAIAKVHSLQRRYSFLEPTNAVKESTKKQISSSSLDLQSVLRAAASLSEEVVLEKLLEKLLLIVIENAGAQNGYLLRPRDNKIYQDANSKLENNNICQIKSIPLDEVHDVSHAIVRKVHNTRTTISIDDVRQDPLYSSDKDLIHLKSKSVLCFPIMSKGEMTAILYLDNAASTHAFTRNRMEILNLLSGQIAVSIENAQLYQNLEQKVLERTSTIEKQKVLLEDEKQKSESLILNILPDEIVAELKNNGNSKPRTL